ncbi:hypothetical protein [Streptomyces sp. NPDC019890]|uniref:hypothetical protein n=1 Tax=Streptomyces sp. NPDC019890 TaxID=3365064 RepID=UPI00384F4B30
MEITHGARGTIVVTGTGGSTMDQLDDVLAAQLRAVCVAVRGVLVEWQTRPPTGEVAARAEVLAAARHQVKALAH